MDLVIIICLILLNGVFAMSELALVSARRLRLERLAENGSSGAKSALQLSDSPNHFLSTVQVGITIIGIFNGAIGEASLVARLSPTLSGLPVVGPYAREVSLAVVVLGITFASIIFGELVPKRIALLYPETVATIVAGPMQWLSRIMAPFVRVLSYASDLVMRLLNLHGTRDQQVTEEEITGMLREGTQAGLFEKSEHDMVTRALRLDDLRLGALMTPRADVDYIDLEQPSEDILKRIAESPFNRFPVCMGGMDNLLGIVHAGDLFAQVIANSKLSGIDISSVTKPPLYVPESLSGMDLLETLKKHRTEIALVVDEYGEIEGMVTLSDVMSALVGDVTVVDEEQEADAVQREDGSWLIDGGVSLDRFRDLLQTDARFPEESSGSYHTLAGFVLTQLRRIPNVSEHFEWDRFRFEVVDMDRNRIDRLLVTRLPEPEVAKAEAN